MTTFASTSHCLKRNEFEENGPSGLSLRKYRHSCKIDLAIAVFVIALLTPNWTIIDFTNTDLEEIHVQLGVWGEWRTKTNGTKQTGMLAFAE
ncbi:unnamed protein product [Gongylonema pulchrum]|uniref:Neur_chan_LBD domain-containing protein n=1 Tax=Gongylonema pulchrum TaxID=637853 RepID=A0A183CZG7_9BILA|nr:unnamed protein product [Gongylonema pulchrum]